MSDISSQNRLKQIESLKWKILKWKVPKIMESQSAKLIDLEKGK